MIAQQFVLHPESRAPFTRINQRTPMTLVMHGLIASGRLLLLSLEELTSLLQRTSRGHFGAAEATAAYSPALLARSYRYIADEILHPLKHRIRELLQQVPFRHHREEIPFFGPIVIGTVLGELGQLMWFRAADEIVAWFGLDPAVFASADKQGTPGEAELGDAA